MSCCGVLRAIGVTEADVRCDRLRRIPASTEEEHLHAINLPDAIKLAFPVPSVPREIFRKPKSSSLARHRAATRCTVRVRIR